MAGGDYVRSESGSHRNLAWLGGVGQKFKRSPSSYGSEGENTAEKTAHGTLKIRRRNVQNARCQ
jgi:hypothetical protein